MSKPSMLSVALTTGRSSNDQSPFFIIQKSFRDWVSDTARMASYG